MVVCSEGRPPRVAEKEAPTTTPKVELQHQKDLAVDEKSLLYKMSLLSHRCKVVRCCGGECEGVGGAWLREAHDSFLVLTYAKVQMAAAIPSQHHDYDFDRYRSTRK